MVKGYCRAVLVDLVEEARFEMGFQGLCGAVDV